MQKYLRYSQPFLILSAFTVVALGISIGLCDKIDMQLWLNGSHSPAEDFFWRYYTCVGEWVPYVVVGLLLFYKAGWASFLLVDVALSGLIGQGLKYLFDTDRPLTYFANHAPDIQLQLVEGVRMSEYYSFPSGHTTTFFALFLTLSVILCEWSQNKATCHLSPFTCYLLALLGGYSRIYLNQHFPEDILGGMIIGVLTTIGLLYAVPKLENTVFWNWNLLRNRGFSA